ncbi:MAG: TIGR03668 family PPOX class F420-dependent oxidoreductase [Candidatus Dormibacteraceae bacterium]
MTEDESRSRFAAARVARLATADSLGRPHVVPVTFDAQDNSIVIAIDHKPKRTLNLRRLRNIRGNPQVSLLVDHYEEEWRALWWVRADGIARVLEAGAEWQRGLDRLRCKYPKYQEVPPTGPAILIDVFKWSGWSYREAITFARDGAN